MTVLNAFTTAFIVLLSLIIGIAIASACISRKRNRTTKLDDELFRRNDDD